MSKSADRITQVLKPCPMCGDPMMIFLIDGKAEGLAEPPFCLGCMPPEERMQIQKRAMSVLHAYRHTDGRATNKSIVKLSGHGEGTTGS